LTLVVNSRGPSWPPGPATRVKASRHFRINNL
jgi:hypothetical protein